MAQRKKKKKISLNEFRAWLEGVEELQPEGWSPSGEQWQLIREKFDSIVEDPRPASKTRAEAPVAQPQPVPQHQPVPQGPPQHRPAPPPMAMGPSELESVAPDVEMTPAARQALEGRMPSVQQSPDGKLKTPNIDISDGEYRSSFD